MEAPRWQRQKRKSTTPTQSIRQNYTSVYSFACDVVAMPKRRYCVEQPPSMAVYAMLNVPHGMEYPARMPVVPNRNEFFALQKTRSQKCTRMYIFDEVVAVDIGGYPRGRIIEIFGPESSGKTTLALHIGKIEPNAIFFTGLTKWKIKIFQQQKQLKTMSFIRSILTFKKR